MLEAMGMILLGVVAVLAYFQVLPGGHSHHPTIINQDDFEKEPPFFAGNANRSTQTECMAVQPYWEMSATELKQLAADRGIISSYLKARLIRELVHFDVNQLG